MGNYAYVLNLVLVKSCAISKLYSTFDFLAIFASVFKLSSKRNERLTTAIKSMIDRISNKWRLQQFVKLAGQRNIQQCYRFWN